MRARQVYDNASCLARYGDRSFFALRHGRRAVNRCRLRAAQLFLLGATGRTGLPFLSQALARGHFMTIYVRNVSKLPTVVVSHPHLRVFTGELHEADKVALALRAAKPDVVYVMLASETAPHTAVSTGTHNALLALEKLRPSLRSSQGLHRLSVSPVGASARRGHTSPASSRACSSVSRRRCSGPSPELISRSSWQR